MTTTAKPLSDLVKKAEGVASPYARHLGIFNPHKHNLSVSIIGCGAVGSFVSIGLAKMGVIRQTLFDFDTVDKENIAVQMHEVGKIGCNKAIATRDMLCQMCPETPEIDAVTEKWDGQALKTEIVVPAADSLRVRKQIWEQVKYDSAVKIIADARLGGQFIQVFAVDPCNPDDVKAYEASFPKDEKGMEGAELPCAERGVVDMSLFSAAFIIRSIRRFIVSGRKETMMKFNMAGEFKSIVSL